MRSKLKFKKIPKSKLPSPSCIGGYISITNLVGFDMIAEVFDFGTYYSYEVTLLNTHNALIHEVTRSEFTKCKLDLNRLAYGLVGCSQAYLQCLISSEQASIDELTKLAALY